MTGQPSFRMPALLPDGSAILFVYAGDVWLAPRGGGFAERLTSAAGGHLHPVCAPDGAWVAFASNRAGGLDVYVLHLTSGETRRLTFTDAEAVPQCWSPDSTAVYFSSTHEQQGNALYRVPVTGGTPLPLWGEPYGDFAYAAADHRGEQLALTIERSHWWRRGPNPFSPADIWLAPTAALQQAAPYTLHDEPAEPAPTLPRMVVGAGVRLAGHAGRNSFAQWNPNDTGLYFVSDRDGTDNLWLLNLATGTPRQLTRFDDGRVLWARAAADHPMVTFERDAQVWLYDEATSSAAPVPIRVRGEGYSIPASFETYQRGVGELALSRDGKKLAFVLRGKLFADFADKETAREQPPSGALAITHGTSRERQVVWSPDSSVVSYVSDCDGEPAIYAYQFSTRRSMCVTPNSTAPCRLPTISPDGKWLAYLHGTTEVRLLNIETDEDRHFADGRFVWVGDLAWSPDSQWLAFLTHDEQMYANVYVQRINEATARPVTFLSNVNAYGLLWSPDGRFMVFTTAHYRSESQIVRVDLRPPEPQFRETAFEKLFEEQRKAGEGGTPGSTGSTQSNEHSDDDDETDDDETDDETPPPDVQDDTADAVPTPPAPGTGDPNGTTGDRAPAAPQDPHGERPPDSTRPQVEIVFAGIERRLQLLTPPDMRAVAHDISPNSRDLLLVANVMDTSNIWSLPLDEARAGDAPRQLTANSSHKHNVQFAPDGKSFYSIEGGQIVTRKMPGGSDASTLSVRCTVRVDFAAEKRHVFDEAWRVLRDTFYDETFGGRDWAALHAHYLPFLDGCRTPGDLRNVLNLMIGELGTSHTGVFGRGTSSDLGYLGIQFDGHELATSGRLRVLALLPDGPAMQVATPPRPGEYLVAIDGEPLTPEQSLHERLLERAGRRVWLRLAADPASDDTREVAVRPIDDDDYDTLRYRAWVNWNRAYVTRASDGRLGYLHIRAMNYAAYEQFLHDLDTANRQKDGLILDVRYNGGGYTSTLLLDVLTRRPVVREGFRGHLRSDVYHVSGNRALHLPTTLLTNAASASDAEVFSELYRQAGLGAVIGQPTAGAVIGTTSYTLLNGMVLRLPTYSVTTLSGENMEGTGRPVDEHVDLPPGAWAAGRDGQLDAAVATLQARLAQRNG